MGPCLQEFSNDVSLKGKRVGSRKKSLFKEMWLSFTNGFQVPRTMPDM